jgi:hypothetical protein
VLPLHSLQSYTFVTTITYSTLTRSHSLQTVHSNLYCTIAHRVSWFTQYVFIGWLLGYQLLSQITMYHTLSHMQSLQFTLRADCDIFFVRLSPSTGRTGRSTVLLRHVPHSRCSLTGWRLVSWQPRKHTWHSPTPEVWRHRACAEILFTVRLPSNALLRNPCYATQQWVDMSQYIFENSAVNINALCNSCEDMACCAPLSVS